MSYESYEKIGYRIKAGIKSAAEELEFRKANKKRIDLPGLNDTVLYYVPHESISEKLLEISLLYKRVGTRQTVRSVIVLDAFHSATIEGAKTTVEAVTKAFDRPESKSDKMVVNSVKALEYAYKKGVSAENIRLIWEKITDDVCENQDVRGDFYRTGMVYVGGVTEIVHTPAIADMIPQYMGALFDWIDSDEYNPWIAAAIMHFYFSYIHPFCDGNGRMARVWVQSFLYKKGFKKIKYVPIARSINKDLNGYYRSFIEAEKIHANGQKWMDITFFVDYFLDKVIDCMIDSIKVDISFDEKDKLLIERMRVNGKDSEISVEKASKIMKCTEDTARKHLNRLVENGVLDKKKIGRKFVYVYK